MKKKRVLKPMASDPKLEKVYERILARWTPAMIQPEYWVRDAQCTHSRVKRKCPQCRSLPNQRNKCPHGKLKSKCNSCKNEWQRQWRGSTRRPR